jgi:predicted ATPase
VTFDAAAARADVEEICRRLDGIPLAIELAAARSRTLTPPELVARLGDRLGLLTGGRRTSAERHRTLRATIGWSHDLLTPPQQVLFRRLAIFAGPVDVEAAASVAGDGPNSTVELDPAAIDDLLGELVERSILLVDSGRFGRRFRLLETVRVRCRAALGRRRSGADPRAARAVVPASGAKHSSVAGRPIRGGRGRSPLRAVAQPPRRCRLGLRHR